MTTKPMKNLTEKFLDDWLEDEHHKATERLREGKHTHEDLTVIMLKHQTNHITHLEQDLRDDIANIRNEVAELRTEMRSEITDLRMEMRAEITDVRKDLRDMSDKLNDKIQGLTWKFITAMGMFMGINTTVIGAFIAFAKFW